MGSKNVNNNELHLRQRIRPSRTAGPVNPPEHVTPARNENVDNPPPLLPTFPCDECGRSFSSAIGLGVHRSRAHRAVVNEEVNVDRIKRRWSPEELCILARHEAEGMRQGIRFMNDYLLEVSSGERTHEAIKGVRKSRKYKDLVTSAYEDLMAQGDPPSPSSSDGGNASNPRTDDDNDAVIQPQEALLSAIRDLATETAKIESYDTIGICEIARELINNTGSAKSCDEWLKNIFPIVERRQEPMRSIRQPVQVPRWRLRRREYARTQELFRSHPERVAKEILDGRIDSSPPDMSAMIEFWKPILTKSSTPYERQAAYLEKASLQDLWRPVSIDEVLSVVFPARSAPGLDGVSPTQWKAVPPAMKALYFNLILFKGGFSEERLQSRTVFIPKKSVSRAPGDFRPISISSVIVRHLHKILASRLHDSGLVDTRQRCIDDGCAENVALIASLIQDARFRRKELHFVSLDCAKAYDSVSHHAVRAILMEAGLPSGLIRYIGNVYSSSTTVLQVNGQHSDPIAVSCGVRQGDPLSTIIFCLVMDRVMRAVPSTVGYNLNGTCVNALLYADDAILVTTTKQGMQASLEAVETKANSVGLWLNTEKCVASSLVPSGREKKIKVITNPIFKLKNCQFVQQLTTEDEWRYLGVNFRTSGPKKSGGSLSIQLKRMTTAPLKPQQRLLILRCFLLPRLYHELVLAGATLGKLRALDLQVRGAVRRWLGLPPDVPNSYFHSATRDGGLGLPALQTFIPCMMKSRLNSLQDSSSPAVQAACGSLWVQHRLRWAERALSGSDGTIIQDADDARRWWASKLHQSVDGFELRESARCTASSSWVDNGLHLSGCDYLQYHHVRINCLPARIRTSRGHRRENMDTMCRAGCGCTETAAHVIQSCHRTHGGRILRHDAICKVVMSGLRDQGWVVESEPHFQTANGLRKPDIIATKQGVVQVIDAQVVSGSTSLDLSHAKKTAYYSDNLDLCQGVANRCCVPVSQVHFTSCTLSWRGVWSARSAESLMAMGLSKKLLSFITLRAIRGSHMNWRRWNKITTITPRLGSQPQQGVG